jgi:phosphoribosylformimino-5-aminoimidazole carboxamide ribotide isomerase
MMAIPAVDLREGKCVQLEGGSYAAERVRLDDPVGVARGWAHYGFRRLHIVDLDAATGVGDNTMFVDAILSDAPADIQVGGGIRSRDDVQRLHDAGACHAIVGTRAIEDPDWLTDLAASFPGFLIVATDVRERRVVTRGWVRTLPIDVIDLVEELGSLNLGGILVTAVHAEGRLAGTDLALMEDVVEAASAPVIAAGGVSSLGDLRALEHRGVSAAVLGMALYTGTIDPWLVAQEFGE